MDDAPQETTRLQKETPYLKELDTALTKSSFLALRKRQQEIISQLNQLQIDYQAYIQTWRNLNNG